MITLYAYLLYSWYSFNGLLLAFTESAAVMTWFSWFSGLLFCVLAPIIMIGAFFSKSDTDRAKLSKSFVVSIWCIPTYFIDSYAFANMTANLELLILLNLVIVSSTVFRQIVRRA